MPNTQAIMEGHLRWTQEHFAHRLTQGGGLRSRVLRDGLILLIDMRFSKPPRALYERIEVAPTEDLLRWALMTFQVDGLVAVCHEILSAD